jgi:glycosyltransferase involved in cell wall biosynthesis
MQIQLYHVNADMMDFVYRRIPYGPNRSTYRIGYWFWELSQFPAELYWTYNFVDEVWSPSRFCYDSFSEYAPVEVRWVPPCVPSPTPQPGARSDLDVPLDSFLIFSSFDARSIALRKNPIGLVDAFAQLASRTGRAVHLLFNVVHPEDAPDLVELLREQTYQLPITLLTGGVSRTQYASMLTACDAYVSLHRSEGLGLPMIEAMYLDKPVIATNYGGCLDFFDDTTGWPVDYRISSIEKSIGPYPAGAKWADPDIADATEKLLYVLEHPDQTRIRCREARTKVIELYSARSAGERFRAELDRLQALELVGEKTLSL